uniref:Uncharacterized protein n=1 Tax=Oncorhynchus mykiss TaxID=8022 RepID=A0A8K9WNH5_ONCMY
MGCTSAKQVSAVPSDEEGRGKAYSNGDLFSDEYKMKGVEEVKYMRGEEDRVNARNQENLVREETHTHTHVCLSDCPSTCNKQFSLTAHQHIQTDSVCAQCTPPHKTPHTHTQRCTRYTNANTHSRGASQAGRDSVLVCMECRSFIRLF